MPTLVEKPPRQANSYQGTLKYHRKSGRLGSPNKLALDAKWLLQESVRLNGGLEWITKWMGKNPDLAIPMFFRAMVPKPLEVKDIDGQQITLVIQRLSEPLPVVVSPPSLEHHP